MRSIRHGTKNPERKPNRSGRKRSHSINAIILGTPQGRTDHEGKVAWSAQYKAWDEAKEAISEAGRKAGIRNQIQFQGQCLDDETGLHYNRYRYHDPHGERLISCQDPIRLSGGNNLQQYAHNPVE